MDSFDVITMGSATQDVFVKTEAETISISHPKFSEELLAYPLGSKILITEMHHAIGGGGTNTATTFARQGLKTGFLGKLGKDAAGLAVHKFLKEESIAFLGSVGGQTGYTVILDSQADDRTLLTFKGANDTLTLGEVEQRLAALTTRWLYASSVLGETYKTLLAVMRHLKRRGTKLAFNPSSYQAREGLEKLGPLLRLLDVLILNKEEAELLTGKQGETRELLRTLKAAGPAIVVITDGAKGAALLADTFLAVRPAPHLKVVETTGAGDAFASGFVAYLAREKSLREALLAGMINAEHVITKLGAKNDLLPALKLDILVSQDRRDISQEGSP